MLFRLCIYIISWIINLLCSLEHTDCVLMTECLIFTFCFNNSLTSKNRLKSKMENEVKKRENIYKYGESTRTAQAKSILSELMYKLGIVFAILNFFCSSRMRYDSLMDYQNGNHDCRPRGHVTIVPY